MGIVNNILTLILTEYSVINRDREYFLTPYLYIPLRKIEENEELRVKRPMTATSLTHPKKRMT